MSEEFIMNAIPRRINQLGYKKYHLEYKDLVVRSLETLSIEAFNELYYIIGDPFGVLVESDYGIYDSTGYTLCDNEHTHKGQITVTNPGMVDIRVKFVQVIIVN